MDNHPQSFNSDTRRRKLDDIFGDDPYLSPTMKARRLHEKLDSPETVSMEEVTVESLAKPGRLYKEMSPPAAPAPKAALNESPAVEPAVSPHLQIVSYPERAILDRSPSGALFSLTQAAALLRAQPRATSDSSPGSEALFRLREQVLLSWLKEAPPRDAERSQRSHLLGKLS